MFDSCTIGELLQTFYGRIDFVLGVFRYPAQANAMVISALLNE
jgi:hypothetical protein